MKSKKKLSHRVLSFIDKTPWAIKPDALEQIISIANRSYSNPQLVEAIKAEQSLLDDYSDENHKIAIIDVIGPIFTRANLFTEISSAVSLDSLEQQLDAALYDDSIKAIILRIDSPGGQVTGTHEFASYLDEACEIKPIVAYVQGMACSAAYWIASATSRIYADKTAILGSIGVIATWTDDSKARTAAGLIDYEVVSSQSPKKHLNPAQDQGRAELQQELDGLADIFIDDVASFRDVRRNKVMSDFGQGSTFLASDAIRIQMADEISSLRGVIAELTILDTGYNNINNEVSKMGVKSNLNKQSSKLKATATRQTKSDDDDSLVDYKKPDEEEEEDINDDPEQSSEYDIVDEEEDDPDDDDEKEELSEEEDEETAKTKKAISALARNHPNLYRAILKRGGRKERERIASIDSLGIVGHEELLKSAKYRTGLTAEQVALKVVQVDKKQRLKLSSDYETDANFRVPTSSASASVSNNANAKQEAEALKNISAGAQAMRNGRK